MAAPANGKVLKDTPKPKNTPRGGKKKRPAEMADESEEEASELEDEGEEINQEDSNDDERPMFETSTVAEWRSIGKPQKRKMLRLGDWKQ